MNYSSYGYIDNSLGPKLTLVDKGHSHGSWEKEPPATVEAGVGGTFRLQDDAGVFGSEGWCKYRSDDGTEFYMTFACPTGNNENYATIDCTGGSYDLYIVGSYIQSNCVPTSDDSPLDFGDCQPYQGDMAMYGHPTVATFNIIYKSEWPS